MAIYATTLWLHYSIRYFGSTANSKARWRKNIRIPEKIVYTTKLSAFKISGDMTKLGSFISDSSVCV